MSARLIGSDILVVWPHVLAPLLLAIAGILGLGVAACVVSWIFCTWVWPAWLAVWVPSTAFILWMTTGLEVFVVVSVLRLATLEFTFIDLSTARTLIHIVNLERSQVQYSFRDYGAGVVD